MKKKNARRSKQRIGGSIHYSYIYLFIYENSQAADCEKRFNNKRKQNEIALTKKELIQAIVYLQYNEKYRNDYISLS